MATTFSTENTHDGQVLDCISSEREDNGRLRIMRWTQTPRNDLAIPPEILTLSKKQALDLMDELELQLQYLV